MRYFTYEAEKLGCHSQIILAGRKVNDGMGAFVADAAIKQMILAGKNVWDSKFVILGLTFKGNCPDPRNSKIKDIIDRFAEYGLSVIVSDPLADPTQALHEYGVELCPMENIHGADCVIMAVDHNKHKKLDVDTLNAMYNETEKAFVDV